MNIISTKKVISFLQNNTTSGEDIAAKASAVTALTEKKKKLPQVNFFQGVPPPGRRGQAVRCKSSCTSFPAGFPLPSFTRG
jgi:hypothetical protein